MNTRVFPVQLIAGRGRGKKLGVPTYNFAVPVGFDLPHGIYAGRLVVAGIAYPAAIHWGPRPVFGEKDLSLEAYILGDALPADFVEAELACITRIREVMNFTTPQDMVAQIAKDVEEIKKALGMSEGEHISNSTEE